jgi:hypothetical protein
MLLHQDVSAHEISSFIQLYEKEWATLYRLTTSTSQVNSESEQYRLMEKLSNEVDNILPKDGSSVQEVKTKFFNLHLACSNSDSAHHMFGNNKNNKSKTGTNPLVAALLNPVLAPTP